MNAEAAYAVRIETRDATSGTTQWVVIGERGCYGAALGLYDAVPSGVPCELLGPAGSRLERKGF